jgi:hypothetical protein
MQDHVGPKLKGIGEKKKDTQSLVDYDLSTGD